MVSACFICNKCESYKVELLSCLKCPKSFCDDCIKHIDHVYIFSLFPKIVCPDCKSSLTPLVYYDVWNNHECIGRFKNKSDAIEFCGNEDQLQAHNGYEELYDPCYDEQNEM